MTLLGATIITVMNTFLNSVLALRLEKDFNVGGDKVGFILALSSIAYVCGCPFLGRFVGVQVQGQIIEDKGSLLSR